MKYKVIDSRSQHFGKILDFMTCNHLSELGGVILKIDHNNFSLFKFNEIEKV